MMINEWHHSKDSFDRNILTWSVLLVLSLHSEREQASNATRLSTDISHKHIIYTYLLEKYHQKNNNPVPHLALCRRVFSDTP